MQLVLVQSKEAKLTLNVVSYIQCASSTPTPLKKIKSTPLPLAFNTHKLYWQPNRKMMQNVVHLCLAVPYGGKLQQGSNNHFLIKKTNRIFFFALFQECSSDSFKFGWLIIGISNKIWRWIHFLLGLSCKRKCTSR